MKIIINGNETVIENNISIKDLVSNLEINPNQIAIEKNLEIIPVSEYSNTNIVENDRIEIVEFIGGG